jgi:hypothetical protein
MPAPLCTLEAGEGDEDGDDEEATVDGDAAAPDAVLLESWDVTLIS